jgi:thiol-disulfide isomerase/thioredoxin
MNRPDMYRIKAILTSAALACATMISNPAYAAEEPKNYTVGFQDAHGKTWFLHDYKGHPVILNLWASWCTPCVQEMPSLIKAEQQYKDKGLVVLALSEDETQAESAKFFHDHAITQLAPLFDGSHLVFMALKAPGLPVTLLIDKNGTPIRRIEGPVNWQTLDMQAALAEVMK